MHLKRLKTVFTWGLALVILYLLFRGSPPRDIWNLLLKANWPLFFAFAVGYFLLNYAIDTLTLRKILSFHQCHIPLGELFAIRGQSYFYSTVNYNAGQGFFAYYLKKWGGASWTNALGAVFYSVLNDLFVLLIAALFSLYALSIDTAVWLALQKSTMIAVSIFIGLFLGLKFIPIAIKPLRGKAWYSFIYHYSWPHLAATFVLRLLSVSTVIVGGYLPFLAFGLHVDLMYFLAVIPIIFIIGALPITPAGLGTGQAAFLYFFSGHVSSPLVTDGNAERNLLLALTLSWSFANLVLKFILGGLLHLRRREL